MLEYVEERKTRGLEQEQNERIGINGDFYHPLGNSC